MKGLILAAGYGSRFLPASKTVPKEMFPLIDRPSIQFIVDEFVEAGITEILIVTSRRKKSLEDYFDREVELESVFQKDGATGKLDLAAPPQVQVMFVRQQEMMGTGHALLQARSYMGNEPFVVAYPDDLFPGTPGLSRVLVNAHERTGASVLASIYDPPELHRYGVLSLGSDELHVSGIVEKPAPGTEPSRHASVGRYLFTPDIFAYLEEGWQRHRDSGHSGEYYHIYALTQLMNRNQVVHQTSEVPRLDTGSPSGYLEAILRYAHSRPDLRPVMERVAHELLAGDSD